MFTGMEKFHYKDVTLANHKGYFNGIGFSYVQHGIRQSNIIWCWSFGVEFTWASPVWAYRTMLDRPASLLYNRKLDRLYEYWLIKILSSRITNVKIWLNYTWRPSNFKYYILLLWYFDICCKNFISFLFSVKLIKFLYNMIL